MIKIKPAFVFIISIVIIFLSFAIFSYNIKDVFYPHLKIYNLTGLAGANISYFLLNSFGFVAYLIPYFLFVSIFSYHKNKAKFVRSLLSAFLFILFFDIVFFVIFSADKNHLINYGFYGCGSFGYIIGHQLYYYIGGIGSFVIFVPFAFLFFYFSSKEFFSLILRHNRKSRKRIIPSKSEKKKDQEFLNSETVRESIRTNSKEFEIFSTNKNEEKIELEEKPIHFHTEKKETSQPQDENKTVNDGKIKNSEFKIEFAQNSDAVPSNKNKKMNKSNDYKFPNLDFLNDTTDINNGLNEDEIYKNAKTLEEKLKNFGVFGNVVHVKTGPVVTMYEFKPKAGIKISKVSNLANDLALTMKAISVRIVAPIPGKSVIGIEISNEHRQTVYLKEILSSSSFDKMESRLTLALGKDIIGAPFVTDLRKMPHLLIAGSTGAGKSVAINAMILSILFKARPDEVKFVMIDPKMLELSVYDGIPHMLMPVVTDAKQASGSLAALVSEMETRYKIMSELSVRNIDGFNKKIESGVSDYPTMPYIVVVVDELADMMMVASKKVELYIARLAQMARAAGIHLIVATQRPSVDVLTGLIKANFSARISFKVASKVDSRTILDAMGAEMLLGKGDMLFLEPGTSSFLRVHGAFVVDEEIQKVTDFVKSQGSPEYSEELINATKEAIGLDKEEEMELDEMFDDALDIIKDGGSPTISYIQRRLKVGYNRAARIVEQMEQKGILSKPDERGKREVLLP